MPRVAGRLWTAEEKRLLRQLVAEKVPRRVIGSRLGRSAEAVNGQAKVLGLSWGKAAGTRRRQAAVRRWHAKGLCPADIARRVGTSLNWVLEDHRTLGLDPHTMPRADRARRAINACRRVNGRDILGCRFLAEREATVSAGWPPVTAAAARHLELFYRLGPATRKEHVARCGLKKRGGESAVGYLLDDGHIVVVGGRFNALTGRRRRKEAVFDLAPKVREGRRQALALAGAIPD